MRLQSENTVLKLKFSGVVWTGPKALSTNAVRADVFKVKYEIQNTSLGLNECWKKMLCAVR